MEEIFFCDQTLYTGRPADCSGRTERELKAYDRLDALEIPYVRVDHGPAATIAHCQAVDEVLGTRMCKNLFLMNQQKTKFYLLLMPGDKPFKTKDLAKQLGIARTSFADAEHMEAYLGVSPGAVTVLGLMNDGEQQVRLVIDKDVLTPGFIGCHPLVNTASVRISVEDLFGKFLPATGHEATIVEL
ncbi:MAG: prolyl-tRNA synthetase associated domain-containing protein [Clostridia bacterium]|nr:prolyl-tRNA synthetase associated domain-containing protein [Clostridia bacterium]